jgi:hypothetical protein
VCWWNEKKDMNQRKNPAIESFHINEQVGREEE